MISSSDRSGYFGASDTSYVVGNWQTKTFKKWWLEKLGITQSNLSTKPMRVGSEYEHKILDTIPGVRNDHQIIIENLRLRVNLDGDIDHHIIEVKTHKNDFNVTKAYWRQAQVEMFGYVLKYGILPKLTIKAYKVTDREYLNYFTDIDKTRITDHPIKYDHEFTTGIYLPKLKTLVECLARGVMPR